MKKLNVLCTDCLKKQELSSLDYESCGTSHLYFCSECLSINLVNLELETMVNKPSDVKVLNESREDNFLKELKNFIDGIPVDKILLKDRKYLDGTDSTLSNEIYRAIVRKLKNYNILKH